MGRRLLTMLFVLLLLPLAACTAEKTQEGEMPDVDVEGGQLPEYDVDAADVDVDTETTEVTVPDVDVDTDTAEVAVPDVDVDAPEDDPDRP
ncbi:MAG: hypothetical protein KY432_00440 [Acidobacteria bacterium]|nr:hypothetical protein [Acidobacteriota bacterium]